MISASWISLGTNSFPLSRPRVILAAGTAKVLSSVQSFYLVKSVSVQHNREAWGREDGPQLSVWARSRQPRGGESGSRTRPSVSKSQLCHSLSASSSLMSLCFRRLLCKRSIIIEPPSQCERGRARQSSGPAHCHCHSSACQSYWSARADLMSKFIFRRSPVARATVRSSAAGSGRRGP